MRTEFSRGVLDILIVTIVTIAAAAIFMVAVLQFRLTVDFYSLMDRVQSDNPGHSERIAYLSKSAGQVLDKYGLTACRSDVINAYVVGKLIELDRSKIWNDYDLWANAIRSAESALLEGLRCSPSNGQFWLRYAMVRQASAENPNEIAGLMELARRLAPAERQQLIARLRFWNRLSGSTLALARDEVLEDVRTYRQHYIGPPVQEMKQPSKALSSMITASELTPGSADPRKPTHVGSTRRYSRHSQPAPVSKPN